MLNGIALMDVHQEKIPDTEKVIDLYDDKNGVSAMKFHRKVLKSINSLDNGKPLRNANPGRLRDKERRLIHIKPSQMNEFISENKDDESIQTQRKRSR